MPPQADPGGTIETDAASRSAFQALLKLLRIPVPLIAALSVALILGAETVEVQWFKLPKVHTALASITILLVVYLGCYRAALTLLRLIEQQRPQDKFDSLRLHMLTETSIHNPFSRSTGIDPVGESSISDYVGLVAIHVPVMIVLITGSWAIAEGLRSAEILRSAVDFLESAPVEETRRGFAGDPAAKDAAQNFMEALQTMFVASRTGSIVIAYGCGVWLFVLLYGFFLFRVAQIFQLVNEQDFWKRVRILGIPFVLFAVVVLIVDGIYIIRLVVMG